jgi:large subunit ribosomal protein L18
MAMQIQGRERRKLRIRRRMQGTAERPRMSVFRSLKHIYAQVVDDVKGATLAHASTLSKDVKGPAGGKNKSDCAKLVGEAIAAQLKAKGIKKVVFDRNGYLYHGRIKALAEAARKAGLEF